MYTCAQLHDATDGDNSQSAQLDEGADVLDAGGHLDAVAVQESYDTCKWPG